MSNAKSAVYIGQNGEPSTPSAPDPRRYILVGHIQFKTYFGDCMKFRLTILPTFFFFSMVLATMTPDTSAQTEKPKRMTPELLWKLGRLADPTVSADGTKVAYTVRRFELSENSGLTSLFVLDLATGTESRWLENWKSIGSLQWIKSNAGEQLWFEGTAPAVVPAQADTTKTATTPPAVAPTNQAWTIGGRGATPRQVTSVVDGIANLKVAPTGNRIAFTVDVKMDQKPVELYPDLPKADARIIDGLMYRHWNVWHDYAYSHLHVAEIDSAGLASPANDLMQGIKADCPVPPMGGSEQFAWSPDGTELAFSMKNVPDWALSTNSDIYLVAADGKSPARNITTANQGYDNDPLFSPDGKLLVYHSMERPGFEADRNRLMLVERATGTTRELTIGLDQTAGHAVWLPDSSGLIFASETRGTNQLFKIEVKTGSVSQISDGRFNWDPVAVSPSGSSIVATQASMLRPEELVQLTFADGTAKTLSNVNGDIYQGLELPKIEERYVEATDGEKIHCWIIQPPEFDPKSNQKWPMLTFCQGGPQAQIGQSFSYRWNFHLMASQGYVVLAPNRRGLPGFGQKWNDEISGDWGGQAMRDLLSSTDAMIAEPYIDAARVAAVGASFGGYSVYWLMGNHQDRFCTMISHCGVFNLESMYGTTEELFFVNHDLGGAYWKSSENEAKYREFSPNRFIGNWKTPLLVIHGEKDFRVPVSQGMEAFTAAQLQGVPSRFLYFPEEGHWVQSPQNSVLWQRVFFEWLDRFCKPE